MDYLAEVRKFYRWHVSPSILQWKPKGCTEDEIRALEQAFGFELPLAYKQYLEWMGKDCEGIFVGCDWFITDVADITGMVPELLEENSVSFQLPQHYLCFSSHQGYTAAWFELPEVDDDPLVWFYGEGQELDSPIVTGTFTDFLLDDMKGYAACLK